LLGDNGAGKSTLIKILSGFHPPSSGAIFVDGAQTRLASPREARSLGIATVHQEVGTIPLMSVARNFFLGAEPTRGWGPFRHLDIARAMYFGARILILDEPTSALGVKEAAKVLTLVKAARTRGIGVVFITHNARHAMLIGDRFVVLNQGGVSAAFNRGEKSREEVLNLMAGGKQTEQIEADLALFEQDGQGAL
jgi:simple sugar transport system ATP-binding protein